MWYRAENPRAVYVFMSPLLIPSSTNRRVDSFTKCTYSCRICPLEFLLILGLKTIKKFQITVIHELSKQIEQRTRIGKIFACWHLAIALTSLY